MDWVINTQGLSKTYSSINALKGLNLRVAKNSIFGFLGPNGAGKTTTIKLLLGLIRPTTGSASIFGLNSVRDSVAIRSHIGYLPQEPRFYEYMSARQILDYTAHFFFKGPQKEIEARLSETLALVGLEDKADRPIKGFSGGERQRLGIAQAQVNYPDLLILDEPAASLDPMGRRDVLEVMERLRKYTTIFYCTHILDDVQRVSDTVAILNHGEMVAYGSIESLLAGSEGIAYEVRLKGDVQSLMQGAVVGEKRSGTAAWVLSKPVSRTAFILSKLISDTIGITVTLILAQGLIAYEITALFLKVSLPIPGFLAALGIHLANILFYLTLTLMLGVLFEHPGPVIGIPLAVLFAQNILMSFFPFLAAYFPWTLAIPVSNEQFPSLAMNLMTGVHVPSYLPLYTTLAVSVLFVVIALFVFEKQEL